MNLSSVQARWFRLHRSGLVTPFETPEHAASALVGIQAQILPAAALSLWNRTEDLTYDAVERLLFTDRALVKLWGQRHTLHLYVSREWPLVHGAFIDDTSWWERRAEREGIDLAAFRAILHQVEEAMRHAETITRSDVRRMDVDLDDAWLHWGGSLFAALVRQGLACHAHHDGKEGRFAHRAVWLPDLDWDPPRVDAANVELTRRFVRAYGPVTVQDVAYWRGARVGDARRWLAALSDDLVEVTLDGQTRLAHSADLETLAETPPPPETWPVRLLYRFDPLLLGLKDKSWLIDPAYYKRVWRPAGHIEGTLLLEGRIEGTWRYDRTGRGLAISVFPFAPLSASLKEQVEQCAHGVGAFFDMPLKDLALSS